MNCNSKSESRSSVCDYMSFPSSHTLSFFKCLHCNKVILATKNTIKRYIYIYKISSSLSYLLNFGTNQSLSFIIAFLNTNLLKNIVIPSWPITEQKHTRLHVFPQERIYSKASGHTRNLNIMPHTTGDEFKVTTFLSHGSQYCSQHV